MHPTVRLHMELLGGGGGCGELGAEAPLQFLAQFRDVHAGHDDEFAGEHFLGLVLIGKLTGDAAVLAILIPAETAVRNSFRADELEAAEQGVALGDLEFSSHESDVHEFFVWAKGFRHDEALSFANGAELDPPGDGSRAAYLE